MALVFFNRYFFWSVVFKNRLLCAYGSLEETQEKSQWVEDGETKPPATVSWEACQREAWPTSPQRFRLYDGPSGWVGGLEAAGSLGKLISSSSQPSGASTGPRRWSLLPAWVPTAMLVLSRWLCRAPGAHWGLRRAATHPPGSRRSPLGVLLGGTSPPPADYLTADVAAPTCTLPRRRGKNRRCMLRAVPPMVTTSYCYCRHYWFSRVDPNEHLFVVFLCPVVCRAAPAACGTDRRRADITVLISLLSRTNPSFLLQEPTFSKEVSLPSAPAPMHGSPVAVRFLAAAVVRGRLREGCAVVVRQHSASLEEMQKHGGAAGVHTVLAVSRVGSLLQPALGCISIPATPLR